AAENSTSSIIHGHLQIGDTSCSGGIHCSSGFRRVQQYFLLLCHMSQDIASCFAKVSDFSISQRLCCSTFGATARMVGHLPSRARPEEAALERNSAGFMLALFRLDRADLGYVTACQRSQCQRQVEYVTRSSLLH